MTLITDLLSIGARRAIREVPIFNLRDMGGRVHDVGVCLSAEPAERLYRLFTNEVIICGQQFFGDFSGTCRVVSSKTLISHIFPKDNPSPGNGTFSDFASSLVDRIMSIIAILMDEQIRFAMPTALESHQSIERVLRDTVSPAHSVMLYVSLVLETAPRRSPILMTVHVGPNYAKQFVARVDRLAKISLCA